MAKKVKHLLLLLMAILAFALLPAMSFAWNSIMFKSLHIYFGSSTIQTYYQDSISISVYFSIIDVDARLMNSEAWYSLDGGEHVELEIYNIEYTDENNWYGNWASSEGSASFLLDHLSDGNHSLDVYGKIGRYPCIAHYNFTINTHETPSPSPSPTIPELPFTTILPIVLAVPLIALALGKWKRAITRVPADKYLNHFFLCREYSGFLG